jgi:hypothetical protein
MVNFIYNYTFLKLNFDHKLNLNKKYEKNSIFI